MKRKVPFSLSDYKEALHVQCLGTFVYVFLGTITLNATFGGLLRQTTYLYNQNKIISWTVGFNLFIVISILRALVKSIAQYT